MIISKGHYGKVQIPPLPKLAQTPNHSRVDPRVFLQVTQLEREQLLLTAHERQDFTILAKASFPKL